VISSLHHLPSPNISYKIPDEWRSDSQIREVLRPTVEEEDPKSRVKLEEWIKRQSGLTDEEKAGQPRPKAALISLVRNEELDGILQSMQQLEYHWNHLYNYPWIFFSEKPFTEEFRVRTTRSGAICY
jgi:Glycolipid 2-alpha-mannosyltransferase